jgi:hypothetical protein
MFIVKLTFLKLSFFLGLSCLRNTDDFSKKIEIGKKEKKLLFYILCLAFYLSVSLPIWYCDGIWKSVHWLWYIERSQTNRNVISHSSNPLRSLHAGRKENLTKKNSFYFLNFLAMMIIAAFWWATNVLFLCFEELNLLVNTKEVFVWKIALGFQDKHPFSKFETNIFWLRMRAGKRINEILTMTLPKRWKNKE